MRHSKKILFSLFLFFLTFFAFAEQEVASPIVELTQLLGDIATMQANFEQFSVGAKKQGMQQKTYGKMYLQRPGKFRWETVKPVKQLLIANGKYVWVYDADLEQVTKRKINYNEAGNPAMLLSGSTEALQDTFKISKLESGENASSFYLQPKTANNIYQWIKLNFTDGAITSMVMSDNLGQQSEIDFSNVKINVPLSTSLFKFTPPPGVDVIENV